MTYVVWLVWAHNREVERVDCSNWTFEASFIHLVEDHIDRFIPYTSLVYWWVER